MSEPMGRPALWVPGMERLEPAEREEMAQRLSDLVAEYMPDLALRHRQHLLMASLLGGLHTVAEKAVINGGRLHDELNLYAEGALAAIGQWDSGVVLTATEMVAAWREALMIAEGLLNARFAEQAKQLG